MSNTSTMPPKTSQNKEKKTPDKCPFNNRGFCKQKKDCNNKHSDNVCDDFDCDEVNCDERHPNPCKFGPRCKFYKKNECMYLHVTLASNDEQFKALNQQIDEKLRYIENQTSATIETSFAKQIEDKFTNFESQLTNLRKDFEVKDKKINALELRLEELEKDHKVYKKQNEKKIKDLENACKQKTRKENIEGDELSCDLCDFKTNSKPGLKTHCKRKHSERNKNNFPRSCDLCDQQIQSVLDLKDHMKQHRYFMSNDNYKCEECEFWGPNEMTMEVHLGRVHADIQECGLCDFQAKNSEELELHLFTCEIFKCSRCDHKSKILSEAKEHLLNYHEKKHYAEIIHAKLNRKNDENVDCKTVEVK